VPAYLLLLVLRNWNSVYMNLFHERKSDFLKRYRRLRNRELSSSYSMARLNCQMISNQPSPCSNPQHMHVWIMGER
jgi:hypothetical protein